LEIAIRALRNDEGISSVNRIEDSPDS